MEAKKKYTVPNTEFIILNASVRLMQDTLQDTFSGGDPLGTGIIIGSEGDDSDDTNRANRWTNHLWEE
jgi:hypothetical protein